MNIMIHAQLANVLVSDNNIFYLKRATGKEFFFFKP